MFFNCALLMILAVLNTALSSIEAESIKKRYSPVATNTRIRTHPCPKGGCSQKCTKQDYLDCCDPDTCALWYNTLHYGGLYGGPRG